MLTPQTIMADDLIDILVGNILETLGSLEAIKRLNFADALKIIDIVGYRLRNEVQAIEAGRDGTGRGSVAPPTRASGMSNVVVAKQILERALQSNA